MPSTCTINKAVKKLTQSSDTRRPFGTAGGHWACVGNLLLSLPSSSFFCFFFCFGLFLMVMDGPEAPNAYIHTRIDTDTCIFNSAATTMFENFQNKKGQMENRNLIGN